ncbi:MAG: hypothetical protein ACYDIA_13085 [Candidatus Humimicrobiaceae bacterium]
MADVLKDFYEKAILFSEKLQLPSDFFEEALDTIKSNLGKDWINKQAQKSQHGTAFPFRVHPLADLITIAGGQQIVEFLELAVYLKKLKDLENFSDVIKNLKDENQYNHAFSQLGYAYRFKLLGAKLLKFEPQYDKYFGDMSFNYDNKNYMVECYRPEMVAEGSYKQLDFIVKDVFNTIKKNPKVVFIKLKRSINVEDRKRIKQLTINGIKSIESENKIEIKVEDDSAEITIKDIMHLEPSFYLPQVGANGLSVGFQNADISIAQSFLFKKDIPKYLLEEKKGDYKNIILIWISKSDRKEVFLMNKMDNYLNNIKRKMGHIPSASYDKMILIILIPSIIYKEGQYNLIISNMLKRIKISSKFTIILASRIWTFKNRYTYCGTLLCGSHDELLESTNNLESILDVMSCWK